MYLDKLYFLSEEKEDRVLSRGYKKVELEDKQVFKPFYDRMNDDWSSPMSFMAMIAWKKALTFYYKIIGDYLVLLGWDATDGRMTMLPLIGHYEDGPVLQAFIQAKEDHEALGYPLCITDMREWMQPYYDRIPDTKWLKKEDDSLYDYVYDGRCFDSFRGKSGQKLRYFIKNYNYQVEEVVPSDIIRLTDFIRFNWCVKKDCRECNYGCPVNCLDQVVPILPELGGYGIIVSIDGNMAGYCIGSRYGKSSILHFQNTTGNYKGLGVFMYSEIRKRFLSDVESISLGEDMGLTGIRTFKTRLAPHQWIPRFEYDLDD